MQVWLNEINYLQTCNKTAITFEVMTLWQNGEVYTIHIITTTVTTTATINIIFITIIIINFIIIILPQNPEHSRCCESHIMTTWATGLRLWHFTPLNGILTN